MGQRQRDWARRKRAQLICELGGKCALCGSEADLQFDHPYGRDWSMRKKDSSWRISILTKEISRGLIRLLCATCNAKHKPNRQAQKPELDAPF